jgi:hypothetical protein
MAILDNLTRLVAAQSFTSSGAVTTNSLPLKVAGRDIAKGEPLAAVFTVTTSAAVAASETYLFRVQSATNADGTTGAVTLVSTPTYTVSGGAIAARNDNLEAGTQVILPIPPNAIPASATHIAGFVALGASGAISCTVDIVPLSHVPRVVFTDDAVTFAG